MPPVAPQMNTLSPCFMRAAWRPRAIAAGRGAQAVDRRLLPRQVGGLGHDLVGLDDRQVGQAAEVGLEAPDALVGGQHRVVALEGPGRRRSCSARPRGRPLPVAHGRPDAQDHARRGADDVEVLRPAGAPHRLAAQPVEEAEGGQRLEDRGPHRVEADRAGHDGEVHLVGRAARGGHLADVQRLAGSLSSDATPCHISCSARSTWAAR